MCLQRHCTAEIYIINILAKGIQTCSKVVNNIMAAISWTKCLAGNQNDVHQVTNKEEAKRGELEKTDGGISEVKTVNAKHAKENGQEEGGVEVITVCPLAGLVLREG